VEKQYKKLSAAGATTVATPDAATNGEEEMDTAEVE